MCISDHYNCVFQKIIYPSLLPDLFAFYFLSYYFSSLLLTLFNATL